MKDLQSGGGSQGEPTMFFLGQFVSFFDQKGNNFFWLFLFPSLNMINFANIGICVIQRKTLVTRPIIVFDLEALGEWTPTMVKTLKSFGLILNIKSF